jgi:hypothetical protein
MDKTLFFPPGVQMRLFELLPNKPRPCHAPDEIYERMEALWKRRNVSDESEIHDIDAEMLSIAVDLALCLPDRSHR